MKKYFSKKTLLGRLSMYLFCYKVLTIICSIETSKFKTVASVSSMLWFSQKNQIVKILDFIHLRRLNQYPVCTSVKQYVIKYVLKTVVLMRKMSCRWESHRLVFTGLFSMFITENVCCVS